MIANVFPLLLPKDSQLKTYSGFVSVQDHEYQLWLQIPENKTLKEAQLYCSPELNEVLKGHEATVQRRLEQSPDLASFFNELKHLLERILLTKKSTGLPPASFYSRLISEINEIGWDKLRDVDQSLTVVNLGIKDKKNRDHLIKIEFGKDYPTNAPQCTAAIPEALELKWNGKKSNLTDVVDQYSQMLDKYQEFWDVMDDIDVNTCVLEPQHPSRADTSRRIVAAKHVSVQISVDPRSPKGIPECQFLGADSSISVLRQSLNSKLHKWNHTLTLRKNLEVVLDIKFPSPSLTKKDELNLECAICYTYRLGDDIPDKICDGKNCQRPFHSSCLVSWLNAVPTNKGAYSTVTGKCPYCGHEITVKITK